MSIESIDLTWIVVKDFKSALKFYTEVIGLKVLDVNEAFGWAELSGQNGGARLGIAQYSDMEALKPGQNGVAVFTVKNLEESKAALLKKGAKLMGDTLEIPHHVKLQLLTDPDGNHLQLAEMLK